MSGIHPFPPNSGHNVDVNLAAAVARNAHYQGGVTVVSYPDGDLTFAQLDDKAARLAAQFVDSGLGDGDRVAYVGLNSPAFLVTMLAAFRVGALFVPVNFRLAEPELERVLTDSGAEVVVCEEGHRAVLENVRARTALRRFLLVDDDPNVPVGADAPEFWELWTDVIARAEPGNTIAVKGLDDPAFLIYTSGTIGLPKGVVLTHGNVWWNSVNVDTVLDSRRGDVTYAGAPLFHIGALNSFTLRTLARGGTVVIRRGFDPECLLDDLVTLRVNTMFAVPAMLAALARVSGALDTPLPDLRTIVVAGAPVPATLIEAFAAHGITLQQAWGLTETAPFATHLPAERTRDKVGSAGIPMPHTQVRVVGSDDNKPLKPGEPGEIVVRGPNVTPGYWRNPEATAAAFDDAGWFHSGDIGYLDEDGCLYVVDRLKDMIISGGENVYPAEVERALSAMPGITDIAVVGAADEQWGETVVAVVALAEGVAITLEDVREYGSAVLARYKLPRRLQVVPAVPRNASGKILKAEVRRLVSDDED
ncbi:long-chain fatty acid--CoA ligase [Actinospica sp.]|jgi:fatty-acyl-CoA synthase|uniref:acyl-CoA synthetase n=1 Tax=Actinospica sp. TaxID=1872142 RepID=UPI002D000422|nr:long-chain fatty acid--CoA ligase [Actinospica sp.]HWG28589.1 long-chain fatty acid--CoA ligase [Actinospica sp.]